MLEFVVSLRIAILDILSVRSRLRYGFDQEIRGRLCAENSFE